MPLIVRPAAAADIDEAFLWYEQQSSAPAWVRNSSTLSNQRSTTSPRIRHNIRSFIATPAAWSCAGSPTVFSIASMMKSS
jgi:hypothetical protein